MLGCLFLIVTRIKIESLFNSNSKIDHLVHTIISYIHQDRKTNYIPDKANIK